MSKMRLQQAPAMRRLLNACRSSREKSLARCPVWLRRGISSGVRPSWPERSDRHTRMLLEIRDAGSKGLGAFATADIRAGTCICTEKPIMIVNKPLHAINDADIIQAHSQLSTEAKHLFQQLRYTLEYPGVTLSNYGLSHHPPPGSTRAILMRSKSNLHTLPGSTHGEGRIGIYDTMSRLNHSCLPNAFVSESADGTKECYATTDIPKDGEITFAYCGDARYLTTAERAATFGKMGVLRTRCLCNPCTVQPDVQLMSNKRRRLLRRLHVWVWGEDLPHAPPKFDLERIRRRAEEDIVASPARANTKQILRNLVFAKLSEAEGIAASADAPDAYVRAAMGVIKCFHAVGIKTLLPVESRDVRWCMQRAEELVRMCHGGDIARAGNGFMAAREVVQAIGPEGEIPDVESFAGQYLRLAR